MQIGKLVCVEFDLKAMSLCGIENACDFVRQEGDAFAESVHCIGEIFARNSRQHFVDDLVDESRFVAIHFRRQSVCAQEGRANSDIAFMPKTPSRTQ